MENKRKVIAVIDKTLSKPWDTRYVIVDNETGEILDNAQGYGYKTAQGAHAAWGYKTRDRSKDKEKEQKYLEIRQWMRKHKSFVMGMEQYAFEIWKGSWGADDEFDAAFVKRMLDECGLNPPFSAGALLYVWNKGDKLFKDKDRERRKSSKRSRAKRRKRSAKADVERTVFPKEAQGADT